MCLLNTKKYLKLSLILLAVLSCKSSVTVESDAEAKISPYEVIDLNTVKEADVIDLGEIFTGREITKTFRLSKGGRFPALNLSMPRLTENNLKFKYTGGLYPGVNGNCGVELGSNEDYCDLEIQFKSNEDGIFEYDFTISFNNGIEDKIVSFILRANSGSGAVLRFEDQASLNYGLIEPPLREMVLLKILNTGTNAAFDISSEFLGTLSFAFSGGSFPGTNGTCQDTLAANSSCFIELLIDETNEGNYFGNLVLSYQDLSGEAKKIDYNIIARIHEFIAKLILEGIDPNFTFEETLWGGRRETKIKYLNKGFAPAVINSINFSGANFAIDSANSTCTDGLTVGISDFCELIIVFNSPVGSQSDIDNGIGGSFSANLSLDYNDAKVDMLGQLPVSFNADGIIPGILNVTLLNSSSVITNHDYGSLGVEEDLRQSFTIENIGRANITGLKLIRSNLKSFSNTVTNPDTQTNQVCSNNTGGTSIDPGCYTGFSVVGNNCNQSLLPSMKCSFTIEYKPKIAFNHSLGNNGIAAPLTIAYSDDPDTTTASKTHEIILTGTSFARPQLLWFNDPSDSLEVETVVYNDLYEDGGYSVNDPQFLKRIWLKNIGSSIAYDINLNAPDGKDFDPARVFKFHASIPFQAGAHVDGSLCSDNLPPNGHCYIDVKVESPNLNPGNHDDSLRIAYSDNNTGAVTAGGNLYYDKELSFAASVKRLGLLSIRTDGFLLPYTINEVSAGAQKTIVLDIENDGDFPVNIINISSSNSTDFTLGTSSNCDEPVVSFSSCANTLVFNPVTFTPESKNTVIRVDYNNGMEDTYQEFLIDGVSKSIGHFIVDAPNENKLEPWNGFQGVFVFDEDMIVGISESLTFNLKNLGVGNVSEIIVRSSSLNITGGTCTYSVINSGRISVSDLTGSTDCTLELTFTPQTRGSFNQAIYFEYEKNAVKEIQTIFVRGDVLSPTDVIFEETLIDFERVIIGESKRIRAKIKNLGQNPLEINPVNFSLVGDSEFTFEVDSSCPIQLGFSQTCNVSIYFNPANIVNIGRVNTATLSLTYSSDGIDSNTISANVQGISAPENSNFNGWRDILITGRVLEDLSNVVEGVKVSFSWENFSIPNGYILSGYNVYRANTINSIDLSSPYTFISDLAQRSFIDTNGLNAGQSYFYKVVPTFEDFNGDDAASDVTEVDSILEVVVPEDNMVMVHKWMLNKEVCSMYNKSYDRQNDYSCSLDGAGTIDGRLKRESFFIDAFEVGMNSLNAPEVLKNVSPVLQTREFAKNYCEGIGKRLPTKFEFTQSALWKNSEYIQANTDSAKKDEIENRHLGSFADSCTVNMGLRSTGSGSQCRSKYGAYDMIGSLAEFTADTFTAGKDADSPDYTDDEFLYNNTDITTVSLFSDQSCFNFAVGMYKLDDGGICNKSVFLNNSFKKYFFLGDNTNTLADFQGIKFQALVGGSYQDQVAGPWNTRWKLFSTENDHLAGFRCVKDL